MTVRELSYLGRYLLVILVAVFVWLQLRRSLKELRRGLNHQVMPVPGCYLIPALEPDLPALPLYHTTCLGHSPACDIRIQRPGPGKRSAIIYLFDGEWFIRPASRKQVVLINGVRISPPTPILDQDRLAIDDQTYVFRKFPQTAHGDSFQSAKSLRNGQGQTGSWVAVNLFCLAGSGLLAKLTPSDLPDLQMILTIFCLGVLLIANLYYFILPIVLKNVDRAMILGMLLLAFLGLVFQIRLSLTQLDAHTALTAAGATAAVLQDLASQGLSLLLGLVLLPVIVILVARTRLLEPISIICAVLTPLLLLTTLLLGNGADSYGATLWINIGGLSIQLTEFAKITYLIVLASIFKNRPARRTQLYFAIWASLVFFLIMLLPDLGSAMILLPTTLLVYVVMTSEYWTTLLILVSGSGIGALAIVLFPHVQRRLAGWTTLWTEVNDSNRQIVYGLQAIARGGLFGRGLGNGSPGGIPLASSDMVFAIVCEELGLLTGLCIVLIFIILWLRSARITVTAQDGFTSGLALAIGTLFFMEAVIVIAGVAGLIPLTGVTLPLIAKGGSSVLAKMILFAIQIGLSARWTKVL